MTKTWLPDDDSDFNDDSLFASSLNDSTTTNNMSTTSFSLEDVKNAMKDMSELMDNFRRSQAEMVEKVECGICHRKVTVCDEGATYHMCRHLYEGLRSRVKEEKSNRPFDPLDCVRIEVYPDDPRGW